MPRLPFARSFLSDNTGSTKNNKIAPIPFDSQTKTQGQLPIVDVGPPFLSPLIFGPDNTSTNSFDLDEIFESGGYTRAASTQSLTLSSKVLENTRLQVGESEDSFHCGSRPHLKESKLNGNTLSSSEHRSQPSLENARTQSPTSNLSYNGHHSNSLPQSDDKEQRIRGLTIGEAEIFIKELCTELAKYDPMNPLLHKISQQSEQGVKERDIEKDAIATCRGMRGIEQRIVEKNLEGPWDKLETSLAPKLQRSSDDELPEKLSSAEVKLLQEQKKYLQREVHLLLEQHDVMMSEIQNLTVRIAELSAVNNDSFKGTQDANPATARPNSSNSMLQLFTEKIKREQKLSGGNHYDAESGHLLSDKESILSFNLDLSPENSHDYSNRGSAMDSIKDKYHEVHVDEGGGLVLRKVNKRGTPNTIRSVGTIFNKFLGDGSSLSHENSNNAVDQLSNSDDSETRSLGELFPERHYFLQHNFVRPVRCEFCENKLWGREYKCRDCGIVIHGKCKSESIPVCSKRITDSSAGCMDLVTPTLSNARAMFGTSLTEQLEYEQSNIPLVVEKCIEAVNKRGLEVEGIYRRSGLAAEIKQLVQAYDSGQQPDLLDSTLFQDICSITSVLKQYLRSLPEPLIPFTLYNSFMDAVSLSQNNDRIQMSRHLIEHMPYAHYQTVKLLLEHLRKVTFHERVNLMTAKNLSVVFGPTLMRNPDPTREIEDMTLRNLVIEHLIINVHNLFDTAVSNDVNGTLLRGNANIRTDTSPNSLSSESSMDTAEDAY